MLEDETRDLIAAHVQRGNELLAEIDEHLKLGITHTGPEHLSRGAELELRLARHVARWEEALLAGRADYEAWRFAMRRDSLRNERMLGEISQTLVKRTHEFVRYFVDEGRAHRDALMRISNKLACEDAVARRRRTISMAPSYRR